MKTKRLMLLFLCSCLFYAKNIFCTPETIWSNSNGLEIRFFNTTDVQKFRNQIAKIAAPFFSNYPYFYKDSKESWRRSIEETSGSKQTIYLLLFDKRRVVGYSTACPINHVELFNTELTQKSVNTQELFYITNILILPKYRSLGLSKHFFAFHEKKALEWGFNYTTFISIQRPDNYPGKPKDYKPVNQIWRHFGYMKSLFPLHETYVQSDTRKETNNTHDFWIKQLN